MAAHIIDIHTHCSPRPAGDSFGVAAALRGTPVGKNTVTNYRGLPAVSYHEMYDFDLQQEACAKAGVTGRIISTPFTGEVMTAISKSPSLDVVNALPISAADKENIRWRKAARFVALIVAGRP